MTTTTVTAAMVAAATVLFVVFLLLLHFLRSRSKDVSFTGRRGCRRDVHICPHLVTKEVALAVCEAEIGRVTAFRKSNCSEYRRYIHDL